MCQQRRACPRSEAIRCGAQCVSLGAVAYALTTSVVLIAVALGVTLVRPRSEESLLAGNIEEAMCSLDGLWYARIASGGYEYSHDARSSIAFFPLYPASARLLGHVLGLRITIALLALSNMSLVAACALLARYASDKFAPEGLTGAARWTVISLTCWPLSMFLRMAYSEAMFILIVVAVMYGIQQNWSVIAVALIAGLATACRPVGVAVIPVVWCYHWDQFKGTRFRALLHGPMLVVASSWGLLAFSAYQAVVYSDGLAFARAQRNWSVQPLHGWGERIAAAAVLLPVTDKYDPSSLTYWRNRDHVQVPLFSLEFMNPIFWAGALIALITGALRHWINRYEVLLGVCLIVFPYVLHADATGMTAQGRYATSAAPVYLVFGRALSRLPLELSVGLVVVGAAMMVVFAALFAAGYSTI